MKFREFVYISYQDGALAGWICLIVSVSLIIASFSLPPTGIVDSSVLAATGELFAFGTLFKLPAMINSIKDGRKIKMQKGNTSIEIDSENGNKSKENSL